MKTKSSILILSILIVVLLSLTTVVASDINSTDEICDSGDIDLSISEEINQDSNASDENSEILSSSDDNQEILSAGDGNTFSDLQKEIKSAEGYLVLNKDYHAEKPGWFSSAHVTISKDIMIDGQGHTLDAKQYGRIFKITGGNVVLTNIRFINGFESDNGGAIYCEDAKSLSIVNCVFENNVVKNSKERHGGAVYCEDTDLKISGSIFKKNSVVGPENSGGGAVTRRIGGLYKTLFEVTNCQFIENTITKGGRSAAIETWGEQTSNDHHLDHSLTIVKDSSFEKNVILDNHGQGKYGTVIVSKVISHLNPFESNDVVVERCDFIYNDGGYGVISVNAGSCTVSNSFFYMNNLDGTCDGVYKDNGKFDSSNSFINNLVGDSGRPKFDCSWGKDQSTSANMGNNFFGSTNSVIIEPYSGLRSNVFYRQGILFLDQTNFYAEDVPHIFNLQFESCYVGIAGIRRGDGEGSYDFSHFKYDVYDENENLIKANLTFKYSAGGFTKSSFEYKFPTAGPHELNFYYRGCKVATINIRIDYNDSFSELDNVVKKSSKTGILNLTKDYQYYDGVDVQFLNGIDISKITRIIGNGHIIDCKHIANAFNFKNGNLIIENLTIINGFTARNGAALNAENANIVLNNCNLIGNVADAGGAIFNNGQVVINNCTFANNTANVGGAVQSNTLIISNSIFTENHASSMAGAVYAGILNSTNVTFELNTAKVQGGAITAFYVNLINNTFNENSAEDGGAAYIQNPENTKIVDSLFINNVATGKGGAVYLTSSTFNITNSEFRFNEAGDKGGAIFIYSGMGNITDDIFDNNHAQDILNGTAIWVENGDGVLISNSTFEDDEDEDYYIIYNNGLGEVNATGCSFSEDPIETTYEVNLKNNKITSPSEPKGNSSVGISPIEDVVYGETIVISVNITNKTTPTYIIRNGAGIVVKSGRLDNDLIVVSDLVPGRYTITVVNPENDTVAKSSANATFNVQKINSSVTIEDIETVVYGENTVINFNVENPTTTYVQILKDGRWSRLDVGNSNKLVLKLDAGSYIFEVINVGTATHNPSSARKNLTVNKAESRIDLFANEDYPYGAVCIYADVENSTTVKAVIKDSNNNIVYNETIQNGFILPDLSIGTYNLTVYNEESRNYRNSSASILFNVEKAFNSINITASNVSFGEKTVINVTADFDGVYTIKIGDENVNVSVDQGFGTISLLLGAGNYTATTTFDDSNFNTTIENATFNVKKADVELSLIIFDRVYSANVTGTVYADLDGIYNVSCDDIIVPVNVVNGIGQFDLGQLSVGNYSATVSHAEDENFNRASNQTQFKVNQTGTNFNIISSTYATVYGNNITLTAGLPEDAKGTVTYTFANGTVIITTDVNGSVNLSNLNAGTYEIYGIYSGDESYAPAQDNVIITIEKAVNTVELNVNDVCYPDEVEFEVFATFDGTYILFIDDTPIEIIVKNGIGKTKLQFKPGEYVAEAVIYNDNYILNTTEKTFTVNKSSINVSIEVLNKTYTQNITGNIYASIDGKYLVIIDDINFTVDVKDNIGEFTLYDLGVGNYIAYVIYETDGYYNEAINQTSFEVTMTGTNFYLIPNSTKISYGDKIEVMHSLPEDATGNITYILDGKPLSGLGNIFESIILNLTSGRHVLYAKYSGDINYAPAEDSVTITVNKLDFNLKIEVENTTYLKNITGTITSDVDGEYVLLIGDLEFNISVVNGVANFNINETLDAGTYDALIIFNGNENYAMNLNESSFEIKKSEILLAANYTVSVLDDGFAITFVINTDPALNNEILTIAFNGKEYNVTVVNGVANFTSNKVYANTYNTNISYAGSGVYSNSSTSVDAIVKTTTVSRLNTFTYYYYNNDMGSDSEKGISQIKVVDSDGNPIKNGLVTITIMNKYKLKVRTNGQGIAKFTKAYKPGTYSVTATHNNKVTKLGNLVLKSVVNVPKVTKVKKSAKVTTIKITLKGTGPIKGKTVVVNMNKKSYKVKTDKNGVALFKVTKKMVEKLGVGKTYKIRVTYRMDSVAQSIQILK